MIKQVLTGGYDDNFSYLIFDGGELAVADPVNVPMLEGVFKELGLEPSKVLITHSHFDHVEGVEELVNKYDCEVFVHKNAERRLSFKNLKGVEDDEEIKVGECVVKVMHTPGHIDDAVCYLVEEEALITGDTLFVGGCGRADFADSDVKDLYESLMRICELEEDVVIYPGHDYGSKPYSSVGHEKKHNGYLLCKDFEEFRKKRLG